MFSYHCQAEHDMRDLRTSRYHTMLIADWESKQREGRSDSSQNSESCVQKWYRHCLRSHKTLKGPTLRPHYKFCDPQTSVCIGCTLKATVHSFFFLNKLKCYPIMLSKSYMTYFLLKNTKSYVRNDITVSESQSPFTFIEYFSYHESKRWLFCTATKERVIQAYEGE